MERTMKANGIITLTTDYGLSDYFVGALKGAILAINPAARLVDISHEIPPFQFRAAGAVLADALDAFPPGTIHLAVVDPGVGSARRAIAARTTHHFLVGPDNGLFSEVLLAEDRREVVELDDPHFFRRSVSSTFHGRDIFAPVAARISRGETLSNLGTATDRIVRLDHIQPDKLAADRAQARVIHIDRFGNLLTNLKRSWLEEQGLRDVDSVRIQRRRITTRAAYFSADSVKPGEPFFYFGSAGRLELAVRESSAARRLRVRIGHRVIVYFQKSGRT